MSNNARRSKRLFAGFLAAVLALTVAPIIGLASPAGAAHLTVAEPIGPGNFCEDAGNQEPFTDVSDDDPSRDEIACLVATQITTGVTATTYEPNSFVSRRQMALFLVRTAAEADRLEIGDNIEELPAPGDADFSDIDDESQSVQNAISQLEQAGVAGGFPDGTYRPEAPVSRRQMAAFIDRLYEYLTGEALPADEDYFEDDDDDSQAAQDSTNAVAEAGIFIGNTDGTFRPAQEITRRQMANVLTRFLQVLFENGEINKFAAAGPVDEGNAAVNLASSNVQQGGNVTGTITGQNIQQVRVSGCGLSSQTVGRDAGGGFTLPISASQPVGNCVLTFVTTFTDGTTETDTVTVNVTAPTAFFVGSPLTTQVNFASTGAAPDQGREEYTFTLPAGFAGPVDIALVPGQNITPRSGGIEFLDANDDARADGLGAACGGVIELVEGVTPAGGTTSYINDQAIPADRVISVTIDSTNPNAVCAILIFRDLGNDNALTLNASDFPTEPFGLGGGKIWTNTEAAFGASTITAAIAVADAEAAGQPVNVVTSLADGTRYEFDSNDTFQLGGVAITQAQFETLIGLGDTVAISYNPDPAGVSVFNITNDVGFAAPATATVQTMNIDNGPTANDVRVTFTVPALNDADAQYKIQRANIAGPDGICGTGDDLNAGNASFTTVGTVQRLPNNTVRFDDLNVPNGCYLYRVQVTNPVSGNNSNSAVSAVQTIPGAADAGAPTSVRAVADDNTFPGQLDSGDRISILFSEIVNADAGDVIRVQDPDGEFANITLGTGNTFTTVNRGGQTLLTITLTAAPTIAGDALPAVANDGILELPLTVTNQTGITDPAGNNWNLSSPPSDVLIEADNTGPAVASDTADTGNTTFTVTFNEAVDTASAETESNYTVATTCSVPNAGVNPVTNAVASTSAGTGFTVVTLTTQNPLASSSCLNQTVTDVVGNAGTQTNYPLTAPAPGGPTLVVAGAPTQTTEAAGPGNTDTFTVALSQNPTGTVVVNVIETTNGDEITVSPTALVFGPGNGTTPQTVTVTGVDDTIDDGNVDSIITLVVDDAASANEFDATPDATVTNTNIDDDASPTFDSVTFAGGVATAMFSEPVLCASVDLSDFTVDISGPRAVTGITCTGASDSSIEVSHGGAASTTGTLNLVGQVTDPEGNAAPLQSRSDTTP